MRVIILESLQVTATFPGGLLAVFFWPKAKLILKTLAVYNAER